MVILAIFVKIVAVISPTEDLISQKRICLYGFGDGCEKSRVFHKSPRIAGIVKEL